MLKITFALLAALSVTACTSKSASDANASAQANGDTLAVTTAFTPDPPTQGSDSITVTVKDRTGAPVRDARVKIITSMPAMSMKGPELVAKDNGDGTYTTGAKLNYGTKWSFAVAVDANGEHGSATIDKDVR